jgi:lipoate---protein ligase
VDLVSLEKAISPPPEKFKDKAVKSIRSKVCNILPYLPKPMNISEFKDTLMKLLYNQKSGNELITIDPGEIAEIINMSNEKYSTWDWIFAYSPTYEVNNQLNVNGKIISVHLVVKRGIITSADINGSLFEIELFNNISKSLTGMKHQKENIFQSFEQNFGVSSFKGFSMQEFINQLF